MCSSSGVKVGEWIKEKRKCLREALGRELKARSHAVSRDKRIQTPVSCRHSSSPRKKGGWESPQLLSSIPCNKHPLGSVSKGTGEFGVMGACEIPFPDVLFQVTL